MGKDVTLLGNQLDTNSCSMGTMEEELEDMCSY